MCTLLQMSCKPKPCRDRLGESFMEKPGVVTTISYTIIIIK